MTIQSADVCIIGGGLMGCFTALFLASAGRSVVVVERRAAGQEASGTNFGNLRLQGRKPEEFPLSLAAHGLWERFETLIGESCGYQATGHAYLAFGSEHHAKLEQYAREANEASIDVSVLYGAEVPRRWPQLAGIVTGATWSPRDGVADPHLACPAVARAARRNGATILENTTVTGFAKTGGGFEVETSAGSRILCTQVLNAAGAWAGQFSAFLGEPVPMFAAGPPIIATKPAAPLGVPSMLAVDGSIIFRQMAAGEVITSSFPRQPSSLTDGAAPIPQDRIHRDLKRLIDVVPSLQNIEPHRVWSGVEGYLPDMLPVIGPSQTTPGVFHAFGFSGHGYQLAPGVGRVMADLLSKGHTEMPIAPFSIARFARGVATDERVSREFDATIATGELSNNGAANG